MTVKFIRKDDPNVVDEYDKVPKVIIKMDETINMRVYTFKCNGIPYNYLFDAWDIVCRTD